MSVMLGFVASVRLDYDAFVCVLLSWVLSVEFSCVRFC